MRLPSPAPALLCNPLMGDPQDPTNATHRKVRSLDQVR